MGLFVNTRAKTPVPTKGKQVEGIGRDRMHGQDTSLGSIRGSEVTLRKKGATARQGHFDREGKFPQGGNQPDKNKRHSFGIGSTGNASGVATGPQDEKQQLAENQKKKRTAAQTLYPKHRSVQAVEAA